MSSTTQAPGKGLVAKARCDRDGRKRVSEIQRARILASMAEVCSEYGAANVTVAHVVARSGVSRRTFYEIFTDREDCLLATLEDAVAHISRALTDAYDPNMEWAERIRTSLIALLELLERDPGIGRFLIVESLGAGADAVRYRASVLAQITPILDEGRRTSAKNSLDLPPLATEGVIGGVLSILHGQLMNEDPGALIELTGPLMSMIVLPYQGPAAARQQLARPTPKPTPNPQNTHNNPLTQLEMRLTYRTVRVLTAVAQHPGSSNRALADTAEVTDQGQMSKLLARLNNLGLIQNTGGGPTRGEPNAWTLTNKGWTIQTAITP